MKEKLLNRSVRIFAKAILFGSLCAIGLTGKISATTVKLTLQDGPLTVLKDSTTTKKINGIQSGVPGELNIHVKWHVMTFIPNVFNKLKIELLHGSTVITTDNCYSYHSNKDPKCYIYKRIIDTEASASGDWKLRVTNNTNDDVNGFNIEKEGTDLNPNVPNITSTFEPDCSQRYLKLPGGQSIEIPPHSSIETDLYGITNMGGQVTIQAKWHAESLSPNVFIPLRIHVYRNGTLITSDYGYSIHSNQNDKILIKFNVGKWESSGWKLKIFQEDYFKLKGFNIEKGDDANPFVPSFKSTLKPCQ